MSSASRRTFLRQLSFAAIPLALTARRPQDQPATRQLPTGKPVPPATTAFAPDTLAIPLDRNTAPIGPLDNDPIVIGIERRLRCSCGCTLDVYTCRTTDFACTYSPRMHAMVVERRLQGKTPEEIINWFVAQPDYGEKVLMAPEARGFNLMGYVVPGLTVTAFGLVLAAWLMRKAQAPSAEHPAPSAQPLDSEQLAKLQQALDEVES